MFVFYDWSLPHMYFAEHVASIIFPSNSWLIFSDCVVFYVDTYLLSNSTGPHRSWQFITHLRGGLLWMGGVAVDRQ